jgi:hypothetical protein
MRKRSFVDEAAACRRQAAQFIGQPEGQFLLRVARGFEELDSERELGSRDSRFEAACQ